MLVTGNNDLEIFLQSKTNQLAQVNVNAIEAKNLKAYTDPVFHGQAVMYHRNAKGEMDGGLTFRMWYWKKDERKKAGLAKKMKDFDTMDEIVQVFSASNIRRFVPLSGLDMDNFIALYTPDIKTYTRSNFDLIGYLNTCYKKYQALPADKRKLEALK